MTILPNGTDAKDIALHFVKVTSGRATPAIMKRTIVQAKTLLESGYTKEEIIKVINRIIEKGIDMYSLGYVSSSINNILTEIAKETARETKKENKESIQKYISSMHNVGQNEVMAEDESTQRNREKLSRFGVQPRFGEKSDFDLFKE